MKNIFLVILIFVGFAGFSQTATNFTCNDCSGGSHDLFTELDAGKVIVLCWVMPCSTCIPNSKTTYNVVNSYQTTFPNRVFFYLCDDLANTACSSLNSWANTNTMPESSFSLRFSDASINMTDYGSSGMPKIVVLGGPSHQVFFNSTVNTFNASNLQTAIDSALAAMGIENMSSDLFNISLFPVPSNNQTVLSVNLKLFSSVKVELYNIVGTKVSELFYDNLNPGLNKITINTLGLGNGVYFVKAMVADRSKVIRLVVSK